MRQLAERVAVITGAAHGIGLALAEAFAAEGCRLVLADLEAHPLEAAAGRLRAAGAQVLAMPTDVTREGDLQALSAITIDTFGAAHILCANAGVTLAGRPISALAAADWRWILDVNVMGAVHALNAFLPILKAQDEAHVMVTASGVGSFTGSAFNAPYSASKAAVLSLTESLYRELRTEAPHVGVTALCPGAVATTLRASERRRPGAARPADAATAREHGLRASAVADMALAAIRETRFWAITHPEDGDILEQRGRDARAGRDPS
ncbi:MAG: short-chain alcohol dehydrogenase [Caulobacter sp.]|nr:short-chain alcohol dehydrogenase [Caulobacter sp.]